MIYYVYPCDRCLDSLNISFTYSLFFYCARNTLYQIFHFVGIPLKLIGMPMLIWFTSNNNDDVRNAIFRSIIFPVNSDGIKDYL